MPSLKDTLNQEMEEKQKNDLQHLLNDAQFVKVPKMGEVVRGKVLSVSRSLVRLDLDGWRTGVVRGTELYVAPEYSNLEAGNEVEATVIELENENGEVELSFREAGHRRAWHQALTWQKDGAVIPAKVKDANRGGLLLILDSLIGFMPVSQLNPEHYPRIAGGDKNKILEKIRSFIGQTFNVKVIDVDEKEEKLIVSEKAVWEAEKSSLLNSYKVGDMVEGVISALTNFGAFMKFSAQDKTPAQSGQNASGGDEVEGLIHISEIAWQRLDHPKDVLRVGQKIQAKIINLDGSKIFLSLKQLVEDPWKNIKEKYQVGQKVRGKILKINPFGLFVELDPQIHGLAHISSLSAEPIKDISQIAKEGEEMDFEIISLEPTEHRLGLKLAKIKTDNS